MSTQNLANSFNLRQAKANPNNFQSISGYKNMSWPNSLVRQLNVEQKERISGKSNFMEENKSLAKQDEGICFCFINRTWKNIQILSSEKGIIFRMCRKQRKFVNLS